MSLRLSFKSDKNLVRKGASRSKIFVAVVCKMRKLVTLRNIIEPPRTHQFALLSITLFLYLMKKKLESLDISYIFIFKTCTSTLTYPLAYKPQNKILCYIR